MNISTGGPHILLFERDQQLAVLLGSELQLAGYEYHTARTAVEVFDAIARYPVRLVLVNMAQAAAARQEFWVALDTQRRGSGIQVLTFHCTNLAGYGPGDPDERSSNADMEVDGMMGIMGLVDAIRARVPGSDSGANTMPRIPRATPAATPRSAQPAPTGGATTYRATPSTASEYAGNPLATRSNITPLPPTPSSFNAPVNADQGEKIRAVLYPNQRTWSSQSSPALIVAETSFPANYPSSTSAPSDASILQRLAGGNSDDRESGLAQLSRMAQGYQPVVEEERRSGYQSQPLHQAPAASVATAPAPDTYAAATTTARTPQIPVDVAPVHVSDRSETANSSATATRTAPVTTPSVEPAQSPAPAPERIGSQPLRAAPIQGLPNERASNNSASSEGNSRRPDVLSRTNYGQQQTQQPSSPTTSPLASITTAMPATSTGEARVVTPTQVEARPAAPAPAPTYPEARAAAPIVESKAPPTYREARATPPPASARIEEAPAQKAPTPVVPQEKETTTPTRAEQPRDQKRQEEQFIAEPEETISENNAVILDILQSLPPMPALSQQQAIQPQTLHGRATRALGNVLLDGHLVPQDRLEVAQNIQRMLRGVDLNYQLGEILLMFKLLTPDQLLAASLVSYGLITTTQISALGHIRQELHAIGLEYDLENLVILFRILTPEQLREVRASLQS